MHYLTNEDISEAIGLFGDSKIAMIYTDCGAVEFYSAADLLSFEENLKKPFDIKRSILFIYSSFYGLCIRFDHEQDDNRKFNHMRYPDTKDYIWVKESSAQILLKKNSIKQSIEILYDSFPRRLVVSNEDYLRSIQYASNNGGLLLGSFVICPYNKDEFAENFIAEFPNMVYHLDVIQKAKFW